MSSALALLSRFKEGKKRDGLSVSELKTSDDRFTKRRKSETFVPGYLREDVACTLPPKSLRDELVVVYFRHIHPLCPVVDEFEFTERYYASANEQQPIQHTDLPLFQAMLFAASLVRSSVPQTCSAVD